MIARTVLWMLVLTVAACTAPPPAPPVPTGLPDAFPVDRYRKADAREVVYELDPSSSLVQIYVYRSGALARLGHDHVIASRDASGFLVLTRDDQESGRFEADLFAPLAAMTVDENSLRAEAGFETEPSESDRQGTRGNMLQTLDAASHPFVTAHIETSRYEFSAFRKEVSARVSLTLLGVARDLLVPVTVELDGGALFASGSFTLLQAEFGIEPFSVLGGALAVQDEITIRFELHAVSLAPYSAATPVLEP